MRNIVVLLMIVGGFALQILSYFFWAAPLGASVNESFSNPRIPFAPVIFIVGIILVFLSAVVYELMQDKK